VETCPVGKPNPGYSCRFCQRRIHRGDSGCACSEFRERVTFYASLCVPCASAVDKLRADTVLGRVHQSLVYEAQFTFAHSDD
jgi:hypothetical protein